MDHFYCALRGGFLSCCTPTDDPNSAGCGDFTFSPRWWCPSGDCLKDCQNLTSLYSIDFLFDSTQSTRAFNLYNYCLNLPIVYRFFKQGRLPAYYDDTLSTYFPPNVSDLVLKDITSKVTHCLISSCDQARESQLCTSVCSPASLLVDSTAPSVEGVAKCLSFLCTRDRLSGLYYGNSDIVGIGVFCSYIAQCVLILSAWLLFTILDLKDQYQTSKIPTRGTKQRENLITGLVEFHKQQCFFGISLQIASLFSGIFRVSLLDEFTLLPLATNSILPLVFGMLLLARYGRHSAYLSTLTLAAWLIASITFWTLYHYLPNTGSTVGPENGIQAQFVTELSQISSCGGYSAQNLCPDSEGLVPPDIAYSALRLSPLIWTWSSVCLLYLVSFQSWKNPSIRQLMTANAYPIFRPFRGHISRFQALLVTNRLSKIDTNGFFLWTTISIFLACFGFQIYLFWTILELEIIDLRSWGFGQIVAVTVWLPPVIEYLYLQLRGIVDGSKYRFAKSLTITRVSQQSSNRSVDSSPMTLYSLTGSP